MKIFLISFFVLFFSISIFAQTKKPLSKKVVNNSKSVNVKTSSILGSQNNNRSYTNNNSYINNYNQSVKDFIEGKYFRNQETGLRLKYGYISSLNTYGLTFRNSYGNEFYFMNCSDRLSSDEQYMELTNCMSPEDGSGVGRVGVYKDRIIISASDGSLTYYLEN